MRTLDGGPAVSLQNADDATTRSLRVCVDGRHLGLQGGTGVATYARNLTYALRGLHAESHVLYGPQAGISRRSLLNEIALFDSAKQEAPLLDLKRSLLTSLAPFGRVAHPIKQSGELVLDHLSARLPHFDQLWTSFDLYPLASRAFEHFKMITPVHFRRELGLSPPNIMHWTFPTAARAAGMPNVYTIHDLVPFRLPFTTLDKKRKLYGLLKALCAKADHIVAVSETTRQDIIRVFGIDEKRVSNTYQAVSIPKKLATKPQDVIERELDAVFNLEPQGYYLFIGAVEPKKNIARLIHAYLASGVTAPLVMVGQGGWLEEQELQLFRDDLISITAIEKSRILRKDRIRRYGQVPFPLLVSLIRGAKALAFPSLYEGFGLPALEAMSLGTPVITSNSSSLKEVAEGAAVLVDPHDGDAIAQAFRDIDRDADLRAELRALGPKRAQLFSQEAYVERLRGLYASVG